MSAQQTFAGNDLAVRPGSLDGITIMRYAHIYRGRRSGGVEQYLRLLDHALLQRHRLTVLQMHLTSDDRDDAIETEKVGIGRILWVPIAIRQTPSILTDLPKRVGYVYRRTLELSQEEGKGQFHAILSSIRNLARHNAGHLRYSATILSDRLCYLLGKHDVDLLALHWLSYETGVLISRALRATIPFVFINHFANERLLSSRTRTAITHAAAVGTVSDLDIPDDLRNRCVNLSDAVDTDFFSPDRTVPERVPARPLILLPARVDVSKGHRDMIKVARILTARNVDVDICFAGAHVSQRFYQELRNSVAAMGLEKRVFFLGEKTAEEIRDLYALSSIVVLPSYSEGLARVLLEAQAMKKPVVAYRCGGTPHALLPNETGFLVEKGDVDALADKAGFLLANEEERLRMGERGRSFVCRKFGISALVQRHEAFYLSALSTRKRSDGTFEDGDA